MRILVIGNPDSIWTKEFIEFALIKPDRKIFVLYDNQAKGVFVDYYMNLGVEVIKTPAVSSFVMKVPKVRSIFMLNQYIRAASNSLPYDVIINMFVTPFALACAIAQKRYGAVVVAYFCGSDIVRANKIACANLKKYLGKIDYAIMASSNVGDAFLDKIGHLDSCKQTTIRLGMSVFSNIDKELESSSSEKIKTSFGISKNKITICIGYNGSKNQNHLHVLESIKMVPHSMKREIVVLLPMTYAGTEKYIGQVETAAKDTGFEYIIFKEYMQHDKIARLRLVTDIFINAQTSDGLSGSVLEAIYAGALVLNASWLNYYEYDTWGLEYKVFSKFSELPKLIDDIMTCHPVRCKKNRKILSGEMSWRQCKKAWDSLIDNYNK